MTQSSEDETSSTQKPEAGQPDADREGPVQTRESTGGSPDRQIAQESQQSTGLGSGQT